MKKKTIKRIRKGKEEKRRKGGEEEMKGRQTETQTPFKTIQN